MRPIQSSHDQVSGEPFESIRVGGPVGIGGCGHTAIVVEIYALGCGITLVGQRLDLPPTEPAFELESNGKVFVFDPLGACHAHGFVTSVKGHIRTVFEFLQAIDHESVSKVSNALCHGDSSLKTVILYLPQGYGKSLMAHAIAAELGCNSVVDDWGVDEQITPGALHLTNDDIAQAWQGGAT